MKGWQNKSECLHAGVGKTLFNTSEPTDFSRVEVQMLTSGGI